MTNDVNDDTLIHDAIGSIGMLELIGTNAHLRSGPQTLHIFTSTFVKLSSHRSHVGHLFLT